MTLEQIEELAALHSVGALDGSDREAFERLLQSGDAQARGALREFQDAAALAAATSVPPARPTPALKQRILERIQSSRGAAPGPASSTNPAPAAAPVTPFAIPGFHYVPGDLTTGWKPMPVPGAFTKLLSLNRERGYAVVLGRLEPGRYYPAHQHTGPEELYMLSGDLKLGDRVLRAGDFHHSDAGTSHPDNYSEQGCILLAVIHSPEVLEQLVS